MDDSLGLEYRLRPELQRSCWYGIVGMFCIAVVGAYVGTTIQNRTPSQMAIPALAIAIFTVILFLASQWKLRVDKVGVWQQSFFKWRVWTWDDFASGRIIKGDEDRLRDPLRPWWRRSLRLGFLDPLDRDDVVEIINLHYKLPPAPKIPNLLKVRFGFRSTITFRQATSQASVKNESPILVEVQGKLHHYEWQDIREAHFTRLDPKRRDFSTLVLLFSDREIEFRAANWSGASSEQLNELFFRMLPSDRIAVDLIGQPLTKREHVEQKIQSIEKQVSGMKWVLFISGPMLAGMLLWMALDNPLKAGFILICEAAQVGPILGYAWKTNKSQLAKLREQLHRLGDSKS